MNGPDRHRSIESSDVALQVSVFHTLIVLPELDANCLPLREKATESTRFLWSRDGPATKLPLAMLHTLIASSMGPKTIVMPSGETAMQILSLNSPSKGPQTTSHEPAPQILIVLSSEPELSRKPSGKNATRITGPV
ncbi:hypothetical protein ACEPAH_2267 [Sanghuangporus vaninii]